MTNHIIIPIGANTIPLTRGKYAIVDSEDFEWLLQWKWNCLKPGYASRTQNLPTINGKRIRRTIYMHRIIMNPPDDMVIDHINNNKLDNRRCNLRICTSSQNVKGQKTRKATSKYKGVYWVKKENRWVARIGVNWKAKHLGYFFSEDQAALAYNEAAKQHYGEFARLNVIHA